MKMALYCGKKGYRSECCRAEVIQTVCNRLFGDRNVVVADFQQSGMIVCARAKLKMSANTAENC